MVQKDTAPVFVLGCPRSGTTLLYYMILSSGGFAVYPDETHVFNIIGPKFGDLASRKTREKFMKRWLRSMYFERSGLEAEALKKKILEECHSAGDFLRILMESMAQAQGVDRWADTTPEHLLYIPAIKKAFPDALIIHSIRDGRDVALSMDKVHWLNPFPWDQEKSLLVHGFYWEWMVRQGRRGGRLAGSDYMEVRFEDLTSQPHETLARIGRFIDHELDYDKIREVGLGSVKRPNTSFRGEVAQGQFNPVGRWKESLPPEQVKNFEAVMGPFLKELGYSLSTAPPYPQRFHLGLMRAVYQTDFSAKTWLKSKTPLGRIIRTSL